MLAENFFPQPIDKLRISQLDSSAGVRKCSKKS
jgi:hypothetical protein